MTTTLVKIWQKRNQIAEGLGNTVFKNKEVETVAAARMDICVSNRCGHYDPRGISEAAVVKGAASCGYCGCKLSWKTRALSDECPLGFWNQVTTTLYQQEPINETSHA